MSETSTTEKPAIEATKASDSKDKATATAPKRSHTAKRGKGGVWLTLFLLLILAGAAVGGYYLWQQLQTSRQGLEADNRSLTQKLDDLAGRVESLGQLEQQVGRLQSNISTLQDQQQALEEALGKLRNDTGRARTWDVEEIATLLQIANDRLRLEGDIGPGLAALEAADHHLQQLNNPSLLEIRRLLAEEINTLRATTNPDIAGMALSLGALIDGIDRLPIAEVRVTNEQSTPAPSTEKGWRGMLHDLWEKLKSLVVIKRRGDAERPLLAPDERYFLRQNLRLDLEAARVALLRHDSQSYQSTLSDAQKWITLYFDNDAPAVAAATKELARLQQIDIAPSLPDISGSLNALRSWLKKQKQQNAPGPTTEAPQS